MIYISYFTPGVYETIINTHLRPSLELWGLKYDIEEIKDLQSWQANTSYKPEFILDMLNKHKEDVVWIDADATIEKYPRLFDEIPKDFDVAINFLDWNLFWRNEEGKNNFHLLSGTMLFRYNKRVIKLLEEHSTECTQNPNILEQKALQNVIERTEDIKVYNLPASYCAIIKRDGSIPSYIGEVVIKHHQASRQHKYPKRI